MDLCSTLRITKPVTASFETYGKQARSAQQSATAPAALVNVKLSDGSYLVVGSKVNGFTNSEQVAFGTASAMPFMLEDALRKHADEEVGGEFVGG